MNATRFALLSAASIAIALAAGCANKSDRSAMQTPAPMTPVAAAPVAQQPAPVVVAAEARAPVLVATAPAAPVMTATPHTTMAAAPNSGMSNNMMTERAPRADRN